MEIYASSNKQMSIIDNAIDFTDCSLSTTGNLTVGNVTVTNDLDINHNLDVTGVITTSSNITADGNTTATNIYCSDLYIDTIDLSSVSVENLDVTNVAIINSLIVNGNFTPPLPATIGVYAGLYPSTDDATLLIKSDSGSTNLMQILYNYGTTNFIKMVLDPSTGLYSFKYDSEDIYTIDLFGSSQKKKI
jgi:hypothetical protein